LQTVTDEDSPELFNLLSAFKKDSGLPVLLNTSLNVMGEPIVENPDQAIRCFLETEMDAMCLGRHLLLKNPADARLFQVSK
jgi:carbamoyltransferase